MVEYKNRELDTIFGALADQTRRAIVARLAKGPATVTELAVPFEMSLNGVSKHLQVLEKAGLLRREVQGREHHCWLAAEPLAQAAAWVEHYRRFWEVRLDSLEDWLVKQKKKTPQERGRK